MISEKIEFKTPECQLSLLLPPGGMPRLNCRGRISMPAPAADLNPFFDAVHEQLVAEGATQIHIDFSELEFMNSSGFKCFVHWVEKVNQLRKEMRYRLVFEGRDQRVWQRSGLPALRVFAPQLVEYTLA